MSAVPPIASNCEGRQVKIADSCTAANNSAIAHLWLLEGRTMLICKRQRGRQLRLPHIVHGYWLRHACRHGPWSSVVGGKSRQVISLGKSAVSRVINREW